MDDQNAIESITDSPFLSTKLFIPRTTSQQVVRSSLLEKLDTFRDSFNDRKMTLVSAPAGYGKTTILSQWVARCNDPVAWLSLDEKDNDPFIFLQYLISALQSVDANLGVTAATVLQTAKKHSLTAILIPLLNDIAAVQLKIYVILDDYHCIQTREVHEILRYIFDHMPPQLHLILATRVDPPLPLAKMRARSNLLEIRINELCFNKDEIVFFINDIMGLGLSEKEMVTLEHRTEGWVAGLQLAAISLRGCDNIPDFIEAFSGDNRYVADYLVEEVLCNQDDQMHDFLLKTSSLQYMSADLCDYILGGDDSQAILENLEQQNLFIIPLDSNRKWFRYHQLFADLLYQRLVRRGKSAVSQLRRQASRWHEENNYLDSAIEYAILAEEYARAAKLLATVIGNDWEHGIRSKIYGWFKKIPTEYIHDNLELCLLYAWVLLDDNKQEEAERSLAIVDRLIEQQGDHTEDPALASASHLAERRGKVQVLRALIESGRGNAERILEYSAEALRYLPEQSSTWRANGLLVRGIAYSLKGDLDSAVVAYEQSMALSKKAGNLDIYFRASVWLVARLTYAADLNRAIRICDESFELVEKRNLEQSLFGAGVFLSRGNIFYERNQLDNASEYIRKDYEIIEAALDINHKAWCYCCMLKVLTAQNDFQAIGSVLEKFEELESEYQLPFSFSLLTGSLRAKIWLLQGEMDKVGGWLAENGFSVSDEIVAYRDLGHVILARYLIAQGEIEDAGVLLEKLISGQRELGRTLVLIEVLLLQAQVLKSTGEVGEALAALTRALQLGEKGECIRVFLNEGQPIASMIEALLLEKNDVPRAFAKKLLIEFKISEVYESGKQQEEELFSARELEILRLIAAGFSNKKIMEKLYISLSTVKTHLRNIYSKLDAHSRTEAVAKANERHLL